MLLQLLLVTLAVPFSPTLAQPGDEGWLGANKVFVTSDYADDAGSPAASTRLEFRRDDAGYGALEETYPYAPWHRSALAFPDEGARWCWRARHLNAQGMQSDPSAERCFRTDFTPPVAGFVDGGAIISDGRVVLDAQPGTDALSGVQGYYFDVAPSPAPFDFSGYANGWAPWPLELYLGEGSWFGWLRVSDWAGNDDWADLTVPLTITAVASVPTPAAPQFEKTQTNGYGDALVWDAAWMVDAGITHVVASFCDIDAGCQWRMGFHSLPASSGRAWQQLAAEGYSVARLAVVQGGQVGPWSPPSGPIILDRTPPPVPPGLMSSPSVARLGPLAVSWGAVIDDRVGLKGVVLEVSELVDGGVQLLPVAAPALMTFFAPPTDGRFQFRVASIDEVGNQSGWSAPVSSVIDSTGPSSHRPVAVGAALDGGALVSISWSFPADALSAVTAQELREFSTDGGVQVFPVTGLAVSRVVPPGEWRWQLRGTDALGNQGLFSDPSNAILVTEGGVAIGPSIVTTMISGRCGEPISFALEGGGDAPLRWTLLSGPPELAVSTAGQLTWTPPADASGARAVRVKLMNGVDFVTGELQLQIACDPVTPDAGQSSSSKSLTVGCGCASFDSLFCLALLALARRRRR